MLTLLNSKGHSQDVCNSAKKQESRSGDKCLNYTRHCSNLFISGFFRQLCVIEGALAPRQAQSQSPSYSPARLTIVLARIPTRSNGWDGMGWGLDAGRWHGTGCVTCSNLKFTGSLGTFETFGTSLPIKEGKNLKTMAGGRNKNRNLLNNLLCLYNKDLKSVFAGVGWVWDLDWVVGYCLGHR